MKIKFLLIISALMLAGCARIEVFSKDKAYTNGLIIHSLNSDLVINKVLVNDGKCAMRLVAGAFIEPNGSDLTMHGVVYLPKMSACTRPVGKLALELKRGESSFDIIAQDECKIKDVRLSTNKGEFSFKNIPIAHKELIERLDDESKKIRPQVDEPERKALSDEELTAKALTCQPY